MVQKKTIKIGIAAMAVVALSIGLGVGISQSNKGNNAASSSSLVGGMDYSTYDEDCADISEPDWSPPSEGKSGKSGPTAPSEGKARKLRNDMLRGKYLFIYYLSPI